LLYAPISNRYWREKEKEFIPQTTWKNQRRRRVIYYLQVGTKIAADRVASTHPCLAFCRNSCGRKKKMFEETFSFFFSVCRSVTRQMQKAKTDLRKSRLCLEICFQTGFPFRWRLFSFSRWAEGKGIPLAFKLSFRPTSNNYITFRLKSTIFGDNKKKVGYVMKRLSMSQVWVSSVVRFRLWSIRWYHSQICIARSNFLKLP